MLIGARVLPACGAGEAVVPAAARLVVLACSAPGDAPPAMAVQQPSVPGVAASVLSSAEGMSHERPSSVIGVAVAWSRGVAVSVGRHRALPAAMLVLLSQVP